MPISFRDIWLTESAFTSRITDGAPDNEYTLDVLPRVGEHVKGLNNRYYRVLVVIHRINDPEHMADYELIIQREELPEA